MKKLILGLLMVITISCVKVDTNPTPRDKEHIPTETISLSVPDNKAMVVKFGSDTLAILTRSAKVAVPKNTVLDYSMVDNSNNSLNNKYQSWQVLAFEDSKKGDFDYNDLVVHIRILQLNNNTQISVHPIALGSTKKISLGVTIEGVDYIISDNCRKDLFMDKGGFLNTYTSMDRIKYDGFLIKNYPTNKCTYGKSLDWFISVDNDVKLYAVSKNYPNTGRPYGLIMIVINDYFTYNGDQCGADWFDYPQEGVAIETVYPDFFDTNKTFKQIYSNKQSGYYPAISIVNDEVTEDCLYAIKP